MTLSVLPFSAIHILRSVHTLAQPVVLFSGANADAHKRAIIGFKPRQRRECFSVKEIQAFLAEHHGNNASNSTLFRSGWLGYFSYEAGHAHLLQQQRSTLPLAEFFEYPITLELDLTTDQTFLHNPRLLADSELADYISALHALDYSSAIPKAQPWQAAWQAEQYQAAFARTHAYLVAGDCYQVNLAMPFHCTSDLTQKNPVPLFDEFNPAFGAYLKSSYLTLFSVSPERFIRIEGSKLESKPIKGTIARGQTPEEDEANKAWLANSAKNQAENLMIVDLLRNDLSKHAESFTVKVDGLFHIETHANVHHMVSTIRAQKRANVSAADVIFDALPGGSITGAPKKRAMEIINELEAAPRGPYCGVLGYFDDSGLCDFNILIRTIVATTTGATCWAGGGVVMDSTWQDEWQELHTKVQRILDTPL